MRGIVLSAAIAVAALSAISTTPAAARDYPYCAQGRGFGIPGDCSYETYEQCLASASGRNLACNINPRAAFGRQPRGGYGDGAYVPRQRGHRRDRDDYFDDRRY
ncbi:MAG: hypothetical protein JWP21_694 [Tardiphaga sp.]|jgi:hypothetical protein|nr:hypothetical protein [Tardiphaga sp.]